MKALKTGAAKRDLTRLYSYLWEYNPQAAERFLHEVEAAILGLSEFPQKARRWISLHRQLEAVRVWPLIPQFPSYLIFYRPVADGVEVLRVIHGAKDVTAQDVIDALN